MNQLVRSLLEALLTHQHLLVELLARTQTCVYNLNIHIRLQSRKPDKIPCHIINLDWLTHVENENLSSMSIEPGLQHKRHSLRNCHKVPYNTLVRHSDRTAILYLLLEQRNDTAIASKHISKTHSDKISLSLPVHHLYNHLTQTL